METDKKIYRRKKWCFRLLSCWQQTIYRVWQKSVPAITLHAHVLNLVYTSAPLTRCTVRMRRVFGARLIYFLRTWGEQRTPGAWKGHLAHPVLFVFAQKTNKFWFAGNVCGQRRTGLQSHPHICAFGSQTIRRARVYEALTIHRDVVIVHNWEYQCVPSFRCDVRIVLHEHWNKNAGCSREVYQRWTHFSTHFVSLQPCGLHHNFGRIAKHFLN